MMASLSQSEAGARLVPALSASRRKGGTRLLPPWRLLGAVVLAIACLSLAQAGNPYAPALVLPEVICAAPEIECNIYFKNVFSSVAPQNYAYVVKCAVGRQENLRWTWVPQASDAGKTFDLTLEIYGDAGRVAAGTTRIQVAADAKAPERKWTVALLAASTVNSGYPQYLMELMHAKGLRGYTPVGTYSGIGEPLKPGRAANDGYGGWGWRTFLHQWAYSQSEVQNIQDEAERAQMKLLGVANVRRDHEYRLKSPLLKAEKGKVSLDIQGWFGRINGGEAPDFILIDLGYNDVFSCTEEKLAATLEQEVLPQMRRLVAELRKAAPKAVIGITLPPLGSGSQDAFGNNYGCRQSKFQYWRNMRAYGALVRRFVAELRDPGVRAIPCYHCIDPDGSYPSRLEPIHARTGEKTVRHNNALHFNAAGGRQMADALYAWLRVQRERQERPLPAAPVRKAASAEVKVAIEADGKGFPAGWVQYGKFPVGSTTVEGDAIHVVDRSTEKEWGLYRELAVEPNVTYEFTAEISGRMEGGMMVAWAGVAKTATSLRPGDGADRMRVHRLKLKIPDGIRKVRVFFYGSYEGTPDFRIRNFRFSPVGNPEDAGILKLKDLCLETPLREAWIVPGDSPPLRQAAQRLAERFGGTVKTPQDVNFPIAQHVVVLGNRADNSVIDTLYRRGFCLTDLHYPGKGGFELRSIHNPTGGGFNVILCGGSEDAGAVEAAALLERGPAVAGHLMKLRVPSFQKPYDLYRNENYPVSGGGYYGWNLISGVLSLFYQTGDPEYAREFLRLAFPDVRAQADLKRFNAESFDRPEIPLEAPYHYCASQMILLWDLVEEHPVFSDAERLKVTRAFARQYDNHYRYTSARELLEITPSRHGQWAHISLYALGRYFQRDYPSGKWEDVLRRCRAAFRPANDPDGWIEGELGIPEWFISGSINPALTYFTLSGDAPFNPRGALANAIKFWETQWDGSASGDMCRTACRQVFHLAADYTGDGKFLWYADLMPPFPKGRMLLGAGFRPTGNIPKRAPTELVDAWTAAPMAAAERRRMGVAAPAERAYLGLSWRDTLDTTGDWLCLNCFNEGYRTPFKLLSIYGLRINGVPILGGFGNFVQTYRNGSTEKEIPTLGEVYFHGQAGQSVGFQGGVPRHAYSEWRRTILLRRRGFAVIADTITPREPGDDLTIQANFQTASEAMPPEGSRVRLANQETWGMKLVQMKLGGVPTCPTSSGARMSLFETKKPGDRGTAEFILDEDLHGEFSLLLYNFKLRAGTIHIYLDGKRMASDVPHYAAAGEGMTARTVPFGTLDLKKGRHLLELEVASVHPNCPTPWMAAAGLSFRPLAARRPVIVASAGAFLQRSDADVVLKRRVSGQARTTTFTLVGLEDARNPVQGVAHGDNAAVFRTLAPMLAFSGECTGVGDGELVLLEEKRIAGVKVRRLDGCLRAEQPVMVDWEFGGEAVLAGPPGAVCTFLGKTVTLDETGEARIQTSARPGYAIPSVPFASERSRAVAPPPSASYRKVAELPNALTFVKPFPGGMLAGAGKELLALDGKGRVTARFALGALVQCAAFDNGVFYAGTAGEEVAAFDQSGRKLWSFTSRMEPSVEATQKYYWFKSAYPGVFSLAARGGRVYAGSACTMEVLDARGRLVARLRQTWGPCREITLLDQPDGSCDAICVRHSSTDGANMWTYNSRSGKNSLNYIQNMPGFRHFNTWGSLFRTKAFVADFDGDGQTEVLADAQGMYCWLNLYDAQGRPKAQLNFGPGDKDLRRLFVDWTVGDVTGDRRPEALLVTKMNQLLVVDGRCKPLWSADLPFQPKMVAAHPTRREIAVLGQKAILFFSGDGKPLGRVEAPFELQQVWAGEEGWFFAGGPAVYQAER